MSDETGPERAPDVPAPGPAMAPPRHGFRSKHPWRTWLGGGSWWVPAAARRTVQVRVSQANARLRRAGEPGWARAVWGDGPREEDGAVAMSLWWFPGPGGEPTQSFPPAALAAFGSAANASPADAAADRAALDVPAYPPEHQARAREVLCPSQWREPLEVLQSASFAHWRGWLPAECADCAAEPGPVAL